MVSLFEFLYINKTIKKSKVKGSSVNILTLLWLLSGNIMRNFVRDIASKHFSILSSFYLFC